MLASQHWCQPSRQRRFACFPSTQVQILTQKVQSSCFKRREATTAGSSSRLHSKMTEALPTPVEIDASLRLRWQLRRAPRSPTTPSSAKSSCSRCKRRYEIHLRYWYKRADTDAEAAHAAGGYGGGCAREFDARCHAPRYSDYFLYSCKSTNTDASCHAPRYSVSLLY
jgi:hypothetical protein